MDNIMRKARRTFRDRKGEYLKAIINELEINSTRTSETCTEAEMNLRRVINLELI
jgi:hypothetical protein